MPSLLEPEYHKHYHAWKANPGMEESDNILKVLRPVIDTAVRTYAGVSPPPTAYSRAKRMTLDALDKYDPSTAKLRTHLMIRLQPLQRVAAVSQQPIVLPERAALEMKRLKTAEAEFRDKSGRDPTTPELADLTGVSSRRLAKLRAYRPPAIEGTLVSNFNEEGQPSSMPATTGHIDEDPWLHFVHGDLSPIDQLIMEHSIGMFGRQKLPKASIATKLGISPGAVSQRAAKIQEKIDSKEFLAPGF